MDDRAPGNSDDHSSSSRRRRRGGGGGEGTTTAVGLDQCNAGGEGVGGSLGRTVPITYYLRFSDAQMELSIGFLRHGSRAIVNRGRQHHPELVDPVLYVCNGRPRQRNGQRKGNTATAATHRPRVRPFAPSPISVSECARAYAYTCS